MSLRASRRRQVALLIRIGLPRFEPNYDAAGNLVDDHRAYSYTYDHDNRMTNVKKSGAVDVAYEYDALGRRIKMVDASNSPYNVVRYYLHSGQNVVAEYNVAATRLRYYVHGPTYIDERVVMHDEANNPPSSPLAKGGHRGVLTKDLYTVAGLADERGWLVESYDYDAYGQPVMSACAVLPYAADYDGDGRSCGTAKRFASRTDGDVDGDDHAVFESHQNGPGNAPSGTLGWRSDFDCDGDVDGSDYVLFAHAYNGSGQTPRGDMALMTGSRVISRAANPYFFTGRRLDVYDIQDANTPNHFTDDKAGLVLYYYRARTMDPVLGRFLQRDPLGYLSGTALYEYCESAPVWQLDPTGEVAGRLVIEPRGLWIQTECGGCESKVKFKITPLDMNTKGWIIQHVTVRVAVFYCNGRRKTKTANKELNMSEAWLVSKGLVYRLPGPSFSRKELHSTDYWRIKDEGRCTKGWIVVHGRVKFVRNYKLVRPPWGFNPWLRTDLPSLPGTPPGWTNTGTHTHRLSAIWNCCREPPPRPTMAHATP